MSVLAIIAALLLEQWRPLGDRKSVGAALLGWSEWLERSFDAGESHHGRIAWLVAVLVPVAAVVAVHELLASFTALGALLFDVLILYLTLGFRQFSHWFTDIQNAIREGEVDRARELVGAWRGESALHRSREEVVRLAIEEAIAASHRHVFAVLFWYILLPHSCGAVLCCLAAYVGGGWCGRRRAPSRRRCSCRWARRRR